MTSPAHTRTRSRIRSRTRTRRGPAQSAVALLGAAFITLGVLGFVPGVTTEFERLELYGSWSEAMLFGTFQVSVLANLVHLGFGVAGLRASRHASSTRSYLLGGGAFYLVLWVYGLVVPEGSAANVLPAGQAGAWLHLVIGLGMTTLGLLAPRLAELTARRSVTNRRNSNT